MNYYMEGNNFNQCCLVHNQKSVCRTIIGSGGKGGYHAGNEPKVLVLRKQGEKSTTSYAEDQRYADQAAVRGEYTWNYKHDYDSRKR